MRMIRCAAMLAAASLVAAAGAAAGDAESVLPDDLAAAPRVAAAAGDAESVLPDDLAACSAVGDAIDRLACYDSTVLAYGLAPDFGVERLGGPGWHTDAAGGARLMLPSEGWPEAAGVLVLTCAGGLGEAAIAWDRPIGNDSHSPFENWAWVEVRYGNGAAERQRWPLDVGGLATTSPIPLAELVNGIAAGRAVSATVHTGHGTPLSVRFRATDLDRRPLPAACDPIAERG